MKIFGEFWGLTTEETAKLLRIGAISVREFKRRQKVMGIEESMYEIGMMLEGTALLESMNMEAQRRILDFYEAGAIFGRSSVRNPDRGVYAVVSQTACRVAFLHEKRLPESNLLLRHGTGNLLHAMAESNRRMLMHADVLGQRSLRQKLLSFFGYLNGKNSGEAVTLPFSLTDCADYLAVDRSAMMRELKKMKDEGIVQLQGRGKVTVIVRPGPAGHREKHKTGPEP